MQVMTPWVTMVVQYGEGKKHLYCDHENTPDFHKTEKEAADWAERHCRTRQGDMVVVAKITSTAEASVTVHLGKVPSDPQ